MLPRQHTLRNPPPPLPQLSNPPRKLINPPPSNNNPRHRINQPNNQPQETAPLLADKQQDRLEVVLEEDPGDVERALGDGLGLAGGGVLVGEDEVVATAVGAGLVRCVGVEGVC